MLADDWIVREIDGLWVVWLPGQNTFLQLQEPAWDVFRMLAENKNGQLIARAVSERYGIELSEAGIFAAEIRESLSAALIVREEKKKVPAWPYPESLNLSSVVKTYKSGGYVFKVSYCDTTLYKAIAPLIEHLVCDDTNAVTSFEFLKWGKQFGLKTNNSIVWSGSTMVHLIGSFYIQLLISITSTEQSDWMAACHASAVSNGKSALLISGPSGSGKSTLAALLTANGYRFVADDFVALKSPEGSAAYFPAALSVKKGALGLLSEYYDELNQAGIVSEIRGKKEVRYLALSDSGTDGLTAYPVKTLLFPVFREGSGFTVKRVDKDESLQLLLQQSWVSPESAHAEALLDWFTDLAVYKMEYSDNRAALDFVKSVLPLS